MRHNLKLIISCYRCGIYMDRNSTFKEWNWLCGSSDPIMPIWTSLVTQMVKNLPAMQETWVRSLGWEDPLEEEMATPSMDRRAWQATVHGVTKSQTQHTPHPFCCCFVQSICIYICPFPCIFMFSYEVIFFLPEEPYFTFHFWKEKLFSFGMEFYIGNDLSLLPAPPLHLFGRCHYIVFMSQLLSCF